MNKLRLKPTYKVVKDYYTELDTLMQLSLFTEGAVSPSTKPSSSSMAFSPWLASRPRPSTTAWATAPPSTWVVDRYRVRVDKRSGIVNDPNRLDDPQYIVRLVGKVITVSLETVKIVKGLPGLEFL